MNHRHRFPVRNEYRNGASRKIFAAGRGAGVQTRTLRGELLEKFAAVLGPPVEHQESGERHAAARRLVEPDLALELGIEQPAPRLELLFRLRVRYVVGVVGDNDVGPLGTVAYARNIGSAVELPGEIGERITQIKTFVGKVAHAGRIGGIIDVHYVLAGTLLGGELLGSQHAHFAIELDLDAVLGLEAARHFGHFIDRRTVAYRYAALALGGFYEARRNVDCFNIAGSGCLRIARAQTRTRAQRGGAEQEIAPRQTGDRA